MKLPLLSISHQIKTCGDKTLTSLQQLQQLSALSVSLFELRFALSSSNWSCARESESTENWSKSGTEQPSGRSKERRGEARRGNGKVPASKADAPPAEQSCTQQTITLASTCLCPHVTPVCSALGNKSPSSPRTRCCQSTLCRLVRTWRPCFGHIDTAVQHCRTKYSRAAVSPPASFLSRLASLL